jgi:molybdopterin biosynthesis enzyme MoaB
MSGQSESPRVVSEQKQSADLVGGIGGVGGGPQDMTSSAGRRNVKKRIGDFQLVAAKESQLL